MIEKKTFKNEEVFLRKTRLGKGIEYLGEYLTVDYKTNTVVDRKLNLESIGKQTGALKANE